MRNPSQVFRFALLINILILLYSAYQVKVNDSEWWEYTFIGVFLWLVGLFLVAPSPKMPRWYSLNNLLLYPAMFLIGVKVLALSSGLGSFIIYTLMIFATVEVVIYLITRTKPSIIAKYIVIYYAVLVFLSWILYYEYPLVPITYLLFVAYCLLGAEKTIRRTPKVEEESIESKG
ncbi:hypothetical protein [Thermococcus sp.]|uniref:hypothetical protein n=1 Tax=Thermococcus sp. TaxID=35749 RepID=UPI0025EE698B|nr:hypothetical protein [Thermococcus sp.]